MARNNVCKGPPKGSMSQVDALKTVTFFKMFTNRFKNVYMPQGYPDGLQEPDLSASEFLRRGQRVRIDYRQLAFSEYCKHSSISLTDLNYYPR